MNGPIQLVNFKKDSPHLREILFYWEWKDQFLNIKYEVSPNDNLVWPVSQMPIRQYEIWKSTCFEFFLSQKDSKSYLEFNLSPSGAWDTYIFSDYRTPSKPVRFNDVELIDFDQTKSSVSARFKFLDLPFKSAYEANITAVIEDNHGVHYYAYKHAQTQPDFHHRPSICIEFN